MRGRSSPKWSPWAAGECRDDKCTLSDSAFLRSLSGWAFALSLVLARSVAAVMLLSGFAETEIPSMIRAGFALAIAALLVPLIAPELPPVPDAPLQLLALLANEILAGATLGFMARLVALSLP